MENDPVFLFRRFVALIVKWLLAALGILIILALLIAGAWYGWYWFTYVRHANKVEFIIKTDKATCADDNFPIGVLVGNSSSKTIERVTFKLSARMKGRSSDLAKYHSYSDDHIIAPQTGYLLCWEAPLMEKVDDPRALEWAVQDKSISFK